MGRAGSFREHPEGYRTFVPNPLPPDPPIDIDAAIWKLLSKADRALALLDGVTGALPNPDLFVAMYIRKEAVLSSQIEGTEASLEDVLEAEAKALRPERDGDVGEVINYIRAMNLGLKMIGEGTPLSTDLIQRIHGELMKGVRGHDKRPGELRDTQNWIGPKGCKISEAVFIPPTVKDMRKALGDLDGFLLSESILPDLVKVGLVHAQFETIHPFLDGNGRMGRLFITFQLTVDRLLHRPVLYQSYFFTRHKKEYYSRLQAVRMDDDFEGWLKFFLKGVHEVSQEATDTSRDIIALHERKRRQVIETNKRGSSNALKVLDYLFQQPVIAVDTLQKRLGISYGSANGIVSKFEELGILRKTMAKVRYRTYEFDEYLGLMNR